MLEKGTKDPWIFIAESFITLKMGMFAKKKAELITL